MASILIIDDEQEITNALTMYFERAGHDVLSARTGDEGVRLIEHARPDLVLLDVSLPEMNGIEVLEQLRAREALQHLPVIAVSAHAMRGDQQRFIDAGFDGYVAKPIMGRTPLLEAIEPLARLPKRKTSLLHL